MKTGGYARTVGSCDLYVRPLFSDQVFENLEAVYALGLIEFVDLGAMGVKLRRYAPRVKGDWAWAEKLNKKVY